MKVINNGSVRTRFCEVNPGEVFSFNNHGLSSDNYYMKIPEVKYYNAVDIETGALFTMEDNDIVKIYPDAVIYMHPIETNKDD